jgi:hypothetical protein
LFDELTCRSAPESATGPVGAMVIPDDARCCRVLEKAALLDEQPNHRHEHCPRATVIYIPARRDLSLLPKLAYRVLESLDAQALGGAVEIWRLADHLFAPLTRPAARIKSNLVF